MIRGLFYLVLLSGLAIVLFFVPVGSKTMWQHLSAIWSTKEAKEMRKEVGEKAGPTADKIKRGVEAGLREATSDEVSPPKSQASDDKKTNPGAKSDPNSPTPAAPVVGNDALAVEKAVGAISVAWASKDYAMVKRLADAGLTANPNNVEMLSYAVLSACKLGDAPSATESLAKLKKREQDKLRKLCSADGVSL